MNPNDNQNQTNPVANNPQDGVNSIAPIAPKDEIPMSLEKVEEPVAPTPAQEITIAPTPEPVTSIFSQNLNQPTNPEVQPSTPISTSSTENKDSLYNFQTNAINPNATVNIDDFRIDEEKKTNIDEMANMESTTFNQKTELPVNENVPTPTPQTSVFQSNSSPANTSTTISQTPETQPAANITNTTSVPHNNTIMIAILGVILALGLVTGAYFVFFRGGQTSQDNNYVAGQYQTEKIVVTQNTNTNVLTTDEYKTTVKSYIERYNNNLRNSKVKLATPNMTIEQKLEVYMSYSTEVLNIYTELQNLTVPERFKDSHDKLTLSLYALNSLFDTLIIEAKNKTLTTATEKQITESVTKAEDTAVKAFNEIVNSQ